MGVMMRVALDRDVIRSYLNAVLGRLTLTRSVRYSVW